MLEKSNTWPASLTLLRQVVLKAAVANTAMHHRRRFASTKGAACRTREAELNNFKVTAEAQLIIVQALLPGGSRLTPRDAVLGG